MRTLMPPTITGYGAESRRMEAAKGRKEVGAVGGLKIGGA